MTDEELEKRFKAIEGDVSIAAFLLMVLIVLGCLCTLLGIIHIQTILCEQKPVQSCPK